MALVNRIGGHRISVNYCFAYITESLIHRVCESMNQRRLLISCNHETGAPVLLQILDDRCDEFRLAVNRSASTSIDPQSGGYRANKLRDLCIAHRQTMIRFSSGGTCRALHHVEAAHWSWGFRPTSGSEIPGVPGKTGETTRQEVSIQRQNHIRFGEAALGFDGLVKSHHRPSARVVTIYRLVLVPFRRREQPQYSV